MPSDKRQCLAADAERIPIAFEYKNEILRIGRNPDKYKYMFPLYLVAMKGCAGIFGHGLRSPFPSVMHHQLRALSPYVLSNRCKSHPQW